MIGAIDDATGQVLFLLFRPTEDQVGYILLLRAIAYEYGLPMSIYHDRHTILRSPKQPTLDDELAGQPPMSQVQRMMAELGIESITAHSPQAKGRIERLWGTLQDRLTKELRLAGMTTFGRRERFSASLPRPLQCPLRLSPRADPESAWVPLPTDFDSTYYFAVRDTRKVRADHCIRFAGQWLQLLPEPTHVNLVGQTVTVHAVPEGEKPARCITVTTASPIVRSAPLRPSVRRRPRSRPGPSCPRNPTPRQGKGRGCMASASGLACTVGAASCARHRRNLRGG